MPESATLPAPAPPHSCSRSARWGTRVDVLLGVLVVAVAFLAGSFVARNSDLWLHLATGQRLATGGYHFGTDPFAFTTAGVYWANHAWLFDLGMYTAFGALGGAGLVVLKALALAGMALAMLVAARGRGPAWVAAACVMLAVLAVGPRMLLQPAVASYLLLAVTLCCMLSGGKALRAVPVLIALWVNLDAWFLLGPALVLLFWVGRRITPDRASLPAWPTWLVPASLAACLVSPHHVFALTLPMELSPSVHTSEFASDPRFAGVFASPWHLAPLGAAGGYNLGAWAFFALLALGAVSFALNRDAVRSWRSVVWLSFAALAVWQARLIPFFAIVAGPIAALNLREAMTAWSFARPGRAAVLLASLALLPLAWFGWLTGFHNRDRGVAWAVHTDPTLERAAKGIAAWRKAANVPTDARVFNAHIDLAHYLAWFAPDERSFLDSRLQLFTPVASDSVAISRGLGPLPGEAAAKDDLLRKHHIAAIALYDPDISRMARALRSDTRQGIARIDGAAVLLVPGGTGFDPDRLAFKDAADLGAALNGPASLREPRTWLQAEPERGRKGTWEADTAGVFLRLSESSATKAPALPLLAIRAARVGLEHEASDPLAWFWLAQSYMNLSETELERQAAVGFTPVEQVRLVQVTVALVQAVLLNPDLVPPREALSAMLRRRNAMDLAYIHAAEALRLARRNGPLGGETAQAFNERTAQSAALVGQLERFVSDAENRFVIHTVGNSGDPLARARIAVGLGLKQRAIDVLLGSHADLYGPEGISLLADLLLQTGQASECRVLLDRIGRKNVDALGQYNLPGKPHPDGHRWSYRFDTIDWFDLCQSASAGRYPAALAACDRLIAAFEREEAAAVPHRTQLIARQFRAEFPLWVPPTPVLAPILSHQIRNELVEQLRHTRFLSVAAADLHTLAGVLELERGDATAATQRFDAALALYKKSAAIAPALPGEPLARRYQELVRKHR